MLLNTLNNLSLQVASLKNIYTFRPLTHTLPLSFITQHNKDNTTLTTL